MSYKCTEKLTIKKTINTCTKSKNAFIMPFLTKLVQRILEKLSYLLLNTIYSYPEDNVILLIEGSGWKEGSLIWIKNAVKKYNANFDIYEQSLRILQPMLAPNQKPLTKKRILVMNTSEFIAFFQKNFTD